MHKPIYNRQGWVLGTCAECGEVNYVEPHGLTADCPGCGKTTEHANIPYQYRDRSGCFLVRTPKKEK